MERIDALPRPDGTPKESELMPIRRRAIDLFVLGGVLSLMTPGARQLGAQTAAPAQPDSSGPLQGPADGAPAIRALFRQNCEKCHGADGTGRPARDSLAEIPDFTDAAWQARRSDAQRLTSIQNGKGADMPAWRGKVSEEQARGLLTYVRTFAPTTKPPGQKEEKEPTPSNLTERLLPLRKEMDDLRKQARDLSKDTPDGAPSKPSESSQGSAASKPSEPQPSAARPPSAAAASGAPAVRALFRQNCEKCHGVDGTGLPARDSLADIPDFTDASWQARRSDAQRLTSIQNGKGADMPAWRGKVSEEQARGLLTYVRAFAPAAKKAGQKEPKVPAPAEPTEAKPPGRSL